MKKNNKNTKRKTTIEEQFNRPFEKDGDLLRMAWSLSSYAGMDACTPVYVLK